MLSVQLRLLIKKNWWCNGMLSQFWRLNRLSKVVTRSLYRYAILTVPGTGALFDTTRSEFIQQALK